MDEAAKRKKWRKPQIIVLVRSKPEESLLDGCKATSIGATSGSGNTMCETTEPCAFCNTFAAS